MYLVNSPTNYKAPIIATTAEQVQSKVNHWRESGNKIVFVPTMGHLHEGHLTLVESVLKFGNRVIVSIFVNPTQFGKNEDLSTYPRTFDEDMSKLAKLGVDMIFAPETEVLYPGSVESTTLITIAGLSDILDGEFRPDFFIGVATVVNKLFNIVMPDIAVFGEKDFQQLQVVKKMVTDLALPVEIVPVATVREPNGLAMSSRNGYLSAEQRELASELYVSLQGLVKSVQQDCDVTVAENLAAEQLKAKGFEVDYVSVRLLDDIRVTVTGELSASDNHSFIVLAAAKLGTVRLIDNIQFQTVNAIDCDKTPA